MLVLVGLIAILSSTEKALGLIDDLPFIAVATKAEWEIKLLILIAVFVYAFFKFTWSLHQHGFVSVMVNRANRNRPNFDRAAVFFCVSRLNSLGNAMTRITDVIVSFQKSSIYQA